MEPHSHGDADEALAALRAALWSATSRSRCPVTEQQWEYRSSQTGTHPQARNEELGTWAAEGWELVSTCYDSNSFLVYYFWRRPRR